MVFSLYNSISIFIHPTFPALDIAFIKGISIAPCFLNQEIHP